MPDTAVLPAIVFVLTYLGMAVGGIPGLKVDRTGVALIAVAVLLATESVAPAAAARAIDGTTLVLMFGLMILSAQFDVAGLYGMAAQRIVGAAARPRRLLVLTILVGGGLSMVLVNDIVVFAMTPILCAGLAAQGRDARPYLVALAGAANAGSTATLIGNPQNILIGQLGHLDFWRFFGVCAPPALVGLVCVYAAVRWVWRRELSADVGGTPAPAPVPLDRLQLWKGAIAAVVLLGLFATDLPREVSALAIAAILLASQRISSRQLIAETDWQLLLLIACLFVVTDAFSSHLTEIAGARFAHLPGPESLRTLTPAALVLSNTIGNVPATILIVSIWPHLAPGTFYGLAILSTLAGNLLLVGSLCNIIVTERAAVHKVNLSFGDFARAGVPMTVASLAVAAAWLAAGAWMRP